MSKQFWKEYGNNNTEQQQQQQQYWTVNGLETILDDHHEVALGTKLTSTVRARLFGSISQ